MATGRLAALEGAPRVFGDTSFFFATADPTDANHQRSREISEVVKTLGIRVYTTWEIVVESVTLLRYRANFPTSHRFLTETLPILALLHSSEAERKAAIAFYLQRSASQRLSLCDALSYVIVSSRLNWAPCLTFDRHFAALGLTVVR